MTQRPEAIFKKIRSRLKEVRLKTFSEPNLNYDIKLAEEELDKWPEYIPNLKKLMKILGAITQKILTTVRMKVAEEPALNLVILKDELKEYSLSEFLINKKKFILDQLDDVEQDLMVIQTKPGSNIIQGYIKNFIAEYSTKTKKILVKVPNISQEEELELIESFSILGDRIQNLNDEILDMNEPNTKEKKAVKKEIEKLTKKAVSEWNGVMKLVHAKLEQVYSLKPNTVILHSKKRGVEDIEIKD